MTTSESPSIERSFSELFSVSDLHLGGVGPERQVFKDGPLLAAFIRGLMKRDAESLALVLNGDVVDFLAEPDASVFDPAGAIAKLQRIIQDPSFAPVWDALRAFVASDPPPANSQRKPGTQQPRRTLVFVLGNHDVELGLPHVEAWLTAWLAQGDDAARGRIVWATEGAGFSALVGGRRVLCVHGNEADDWNLVDHLALLQAARAYNRGMPAPKWQSNAGSRLVIDVMNPIKKDLPYVDLLKPEIEATVPILAALRPSSLKQIGAAASLAGRKVIDGLRSMGGFLGDEAESEPARELEGDELVRRLIVDLDTEAEPATDLEKRIRYLQQRIEDNQERLAAPTSAREQVFLSSDSPGERARGREMLRAALQRLVMDKTFVLSDPDKPFQRLSAQVGSHVNYLIAGHTHLRRALPRQGPNSYYYNTGTWIRLIELDAETLRDKALFANFVGLLETNSLLTLDEAKTSKGKLVRVEPTAAAIVSGPGGVYGTLYEVEPNGNWKPLPGTRFPAEAGPT